MPSRDLHSIKSIAEEVPGGITDEEIKMICRFYFTVLANSVGNITNLDGEREN